MVSRSQLLKTWKRLKIKAWCYIFSLQSKLGKSMPSHKLACNPHMPRQKYYILWKQGQENAKKILKSFVAKIKLILGLFQGHDWSGDEGDAMWFSPQIWQRADRKCHVLSRKQNNTKKAWRIKHLCDFQSSVAWFRGFKKWVVGFTTVVKAFRFVQGAIYLCAQTWTQKLSGTQLVLQMPATKSKSHSSNPPGKKKKMKNHIQSMSDCLSPSLTLPCSIIFHILLSSIPCVLLGFQPHDILSKFFFLLTANKTKPTAIFLCLHGIVIQVFPKN